MGSIRLIQTRLRSIIKGCGHFLLCQQSYLPVGEVYAFKMNSQLQGLLQNFMELNPRFQYQF